MNKVPNRRHLSGSARDPLDRRGGYSIPANWLRCLAGALTAAVSTAIPDAVGAEYFVNSLGVTLSELPRNPQLGASFRLSQSAFDLEMDAGGGPGYFPEPNVAFLGAQLGDLTSMAKAPFRFTLEHRAGEGYLFTATQPGSGVSKMIAWGSGFSVSLPSTVTYSELLRGESPGLSDGGKPTQYNGLFLEARSTQSGSSLQFSDLSFSSPSLVYGGGEFDSGIVTPATIDPWDDPSASLPEAGYWRQLLVADGNLASHDWTLSGTLMGDRSGPLGDDEVRFSLEGVQVEATNARQTFSTVTAVIPEPTTWISGACLVLGIAGWTARRR